MCVCVRPAVLVNTCGWHPPPKRRCPAPRCTAARTSVPFLVPNRTSGDILPCARSPSICGTGVGGWMSRYRSRPCQRTLSVAAQRGRHACRVEVRAKWDYEW